VSDHWQIRHEPGLDAYPDAVVVPVESQFRPPAADPAQ
jgi:hypothetical protein